MFQLIVAVISIALVAALALASIYYGGSGILPGPAEGSGYHDDQPGPADRWR